MKLQLTSTKTIDLNFGGGAGKKSSKDLTGVELFSGEPLGVPAVRIIRKKNAWHLAAAGFVKSPNGVLPERWEDIAKQPSWEMPHEFQSPHAALAVNSAQATFGQASADAIVQEMMEGLKAQPKASVSSSPAQSKRFAVKKSEPAKPAPVPAVKEQASAPQRRPDFPEAGEAVSENGRRFVVQPLAEEGFHLSASIPEYQALWLSRLLPEGRRPTAASIQVAESALMASILAQPEFTAAKETALAVFVRPDAVYFAGYKGGEPVLWRRCPGAQGENAMRAAVKKTLGIEDELIASVLDDSLVDPRPALEPFLHPILEQLELARAFLAGKHGIETDKVFLMGLTAGAAQWKKLAEETLRLNFVSPDPFEGLTVEKGVEVKNRNSFLIALGAALAASEVES